MTSLPPPPPIEGGEGDTTPPSEAATCWRGECRTGCYYPDVCSPSASAHTDAGGKGVRLTADERIRALTRLVDERAQDIAVLTERVEFLVGQAQENAGRSAVCKSNLAHEKARADSAEARLGQGVVEWGASGSAAAANRHDGLLIDTEVDVGHFIKARAKRGETWIRVTRTIHTSPWVEVSES